MPRYEPMGSVLFGRGLLIGGGGGGGAIFTVGNVALGMLRHTVLDRISKRLKERNMFTYLIMRSLL